MDDLDPRTWAPDEPVKIYLNADMTLWCLVDSEDATWAQRWRWHASLSRASKILYATRMTRQPKSRKQVKVFMHKEILSRTGTPPPTLFHVRGDHIDRNSLNNCRSNLRWATEKENAENRSNVGRPKKNLAEIMQEFTVDTAIHPEYN